MESLKPKSDFTNRNDYVDYLCTVCEIGLSRSLIYGRLGRGWNPMRAITEPRVKKPGVNHPYKREFSQNEARRWQEEHSD